MRSDRQIVSNAAKQGHKMSTTDNIKQTNSTRREILHTQQKKRKKILEKRTPEVRRVLRISPYFVYPPNRKGERGSSL